MYNVLHWYLNQFTSRLQLRVQHGTLLIKRVHIYMLTGDTHQNKGTFIMERKTCFNLDTPRFHCCYRECPLKGQYHQNFLRVYTKALGM
jgi:hypothetical protein